MTYVIAPTLTGYPQPGTVWLPDQWLAMMSGYVADLMAPGMSDDYRAGLAAGLTDASDT